MSTASPLRRLYECVRRRYGLVAMAVVAYAVAGQFLLREWNLSEFRTVFGVVVLVLGTLVAAVSARDILELSKTD